MGGTATLVKDRIMSEADWQKLIQILDGQTAKYRQLLSVLDEKRGLLVEGKTKKLNALLKKEEKAIDDIEDSERTRMLAVKQITGGDGRTTLMELLKSVPDAQREDLERAALSLMESLSDVAVRNRGNAELIRESMHFVQFQINMLTSSVRRTDNIYEGSGRMRSSAEPPPSGILNKQV